MSCAFRTYTLALGFSCAALLAPRPSHAAPPASSAPDPLPAHRDDEAQSVFLSGREAFDAGDFERALVAFERAYVLSHRPELLFNVATALDRLRRDAEAARYFALYLEALPEAENRAAVEARLSYLRTGAEQPPPRSRAPSPREAARAAQADAAPTAHEAGFEHREAAHTRRRRALWWTAAAVVVIAGAASAVALTLRSPEREREAPLVGSQGAFVEARWDR